MIKLAAVVLSCFIILCCDAAADWPQWRGADGSGVTDGVAPTTWSREAQNVHWATRIPGDGHSSPIVAGNRVFLATAYETAEIKFWTRSAKGTAIALASTVLGLVAFAFGRGAQAEARPNPASPLQRDLLSTLQVSVAWMGLISAAVFLLMEVTSVGRSLWISAVGLIAASAVLGWTRTKSLLVRVGVPVLLIAALVLLIVTPAQSNAFRYASFLSALIAFAAALLSSAGGARRDGTETVAVDIWGMIDTALVLLAGGTFLVTSVFAMIRSEFFWEVGGPSVTWMVAETIALIGLAAAVGCFPASSPLRVFGSIVLLITAAALYYYAPTGWNWHTFLIIRLKNEIAVFPAVAAATWYFVYFLRSRSRAPASSSAQERLVSSWPLAIAFTLMSCLFFIGPTILFQQGGLNRVLLCLDLESGDKLWEKTAYISVPETKHRLNSYATPTPCTDGERVIAYFGGGLACFDYEGELLWRYLVDAEYPKTTAYGAASSPIMHEDLVIVVHERELEVDGPSDTHLPSTITAFDKRTGQIRWQVEREDARDSYATPLIVHNNGVSQLIAITALSADAYDPKTGKHLWSHPVSLRQVGTSAVAADDRLWIAGGAQHPQGGQGTIALRTYGDAKTLTSETLWTSDRSVPTCVSPVYYDGNLFTLAYNGVLACYDAESGKLLKRKRLPSGQYISSLIVARGKLYASNELGVTVVLEANSSCNLIAENNLNDGIYASPAVVGGRLLLRTEKHLYCIAPQQAHHAL